MATPSYTAAKASTLANDTGGAWAHTTVAPTGAGQLIICHVFQDGTSASNAITISSATNCTALDGTSNAYTPLAATGFPLGSDSTPTGYHYIFFARSTGTNASVITGGNSGADDIYVRTYQFGGVHTGPDISHILENSTAGAVLSKGSTSTSVDAVSVGAMGTERLALCFIAVADDIQAAELTAMTGETGGDWAYPVAAAGSSTGTDGTLGLVSAALDSGGSITGGTDAITSEQWGVVGFALRPTTAVLTVTGSVITPLTFGAVTNAVKVKLGRVITPVTFTAVTTGLDFAFQWQQDTAGNGVYANIASLAKAPSFVLTATQTGCHVRCIVTATNAGGSTPATSNVVGPIAAPGVEGSVVTVVTFVAVTTGRLTAKATVITPVTLQRVTTGKVTAKATVVTPVTVGVVTSGLTIRRGQVITPVTASIVTRGRVTAKAQVVTPVTFGAVTNGTKASSSTGQVITPITASIVTRGRVTAKAQVITPLALNRVTTGRLTAKATVITPVTLQRVTTGTRIRLGSVITPFVATIVTRGKLTAKATVVTPVTIGVVTSAAGQYTYTYQWQRDIAGNSVYGDIGSATSSTYVLTSPDVGCHIRCVVTATSPTGATPANSNATRLVLRAFAPAVSGKATVTVLGLRDVPLTVTAVSGSVAVTANVVRVRTRGAVVNGAAAITVALESSTARWLNIGATLSPLVPFPVQYVLVRSVGQATVTATLGKAIRLAGAVAGSTSVTVVVSKARVLVPAVVTGRATITAAVSKLRTIAAVVTGRAIVTAAFSPTRVIATAVQAAATVACVVVRARARAAIANGVAVVTAAITRLLPRDATVTGTTAVTAALGRARALDTTAVAGQAIVTCSVSSGFQLNIFVHGTTATTVDLRTARRLDGAASIGTATINTEIVRVRPMVAATIGTTTATAAVTLYRGLVGGATTGTAAVTASLSTATRITAITNGVAYVDVSVSRGHPIPIPVIRGITTVHATVYLVPTVFGPPIVGYLDKPLAGHLDHNLEGAFT